jgi:1-acyl-sn-glycerol-3-phosphate acyltransferase
MGAKNTVLARAKQSFSLVQMDAILRLLMQGLHKYFRIDVHGIENVPKRGRALIAPNHSGCSGLDAVMLGYLLHQKTPRVPRILTLWNEFKAFPFLAAPAQRMGLKPASTDNGVSLLRKNNLVVCFPEGEAGSFKPTSERYQLQEFKTGFVRMALVTGAPIVPCVIIGAEESNINLTTLRMPRKSRHSILPLPFNILPLPAKWDIRFLEPIDLSAHRQFADDKEKLRELADLIQARIQAAIEAELARRPYVYLKHA